ncbi:Uracil permease [Grifola frondosa]|uniref:Uracil permease n=1 Tax=Grifola frondosa TaxID=5627 RepID=A0A1C7LLN6_GRIFR|nr:Uracil permease [Grifola frondosa]
MGFGNWTLGSSIVSAGLTWWQATIVVWIAAFVSGVCMALNSRAAANYHYLLVEPAPCYGICPQFPGWCLHFNYAKLYRRYEMEQPRHAVPRLCRHDDSTFYWVSDFLGHRTTILLAASEQAEVAVYVESLDTSSVGLRSSHLLSGAKQRATGFRCSLAGEVTTPKGAALAWLFVSSVNSAMGNWSTFIANMPDFSRYATSADATMWTHILFVPFPAALGGMIGIFGTSALQKAWGVTLWNQWDVLDGILEHSWNGRSRFGVFLLAFCSALFNFGAILGANLLPFASDLTALFPTYFNLTRGMWFCCIISLALMPWKILASSNGFLAFLGGYDIFMGPTAAIMISDYWIVRRGNIKIMDAYSSKTGATYMYFHGFNVNAVFAYLCGMMIPFIGFIGTFGAPVPKGAKRCDDLGWYISFGVAGGVYIAMSYLRPIENVDRSMRREQLAEDFAAERQCICVADAERSSTVEREKIADVEKSGECVSYEPSSD